MAEVAPVGLAGLEHKVTLLRQAPVALRQVSEAVAVVQTHLTVAAFRPEETVFRAVV